MMSTSPDSSCASTHRYLTIWFLYAASLVDLIRSLSALLQMNTIASSCYVVTVCLYDVSLRSWFRPQTFAATRRPESVCVI